MYKSYLFKIIRPFIFFVLFLISGISNGQSISGASNVYLNQTVTYSFGNGLIVKFANWRITNGTIQSTSNFETVYHVTVLWSSIGAGKVELLAGTKIKSSLNVTVNAPVSGGSISPATASFCSGASQFLTLSGNDYPVTKWQYSIDEGISWIDVSNTSSSYNVFKPIEDRIYRAVTSGAAGIVYSGSSTLTVWGKPPTPAIPTVTSNCGSTILTRANPSPEYTYYWQGTNDDGKNTTNSNSTYPVTATGNYYLRAINNSTGCWGISRKSIISTINPIPGLATGSDKSRCGTGVVVLSASSGNDGNTIRWYSAATGGTLLYTGINYPTPSISSATTYYAASYNNTTECEATSRKAITATINPLPGLAKGSSSYSRCGTGVVVLSAIPGSDGNTIRWYSSISEEIPSHTGTTYPTPSISSTTTYYAVTYNSNTECEALNRKAITATINSIPGLATGSGNSRCGTGIVNLSASPGSDGNTIRWYSASDGGTLLYTDTTYPTPSISSSTTYYAATYNSTTECETLNRIAIIATIEISSGGTIKGGGEAYGIKSGTLTLEGNIGNVIRWETKVGTGDWQTINYTSTSLPYTNLTATTYFKAVIKNGICDEAESEQESVIIYDEPTLSINGSTEIPYGGSVTLTADAGHYSYQWIKGGIDIVGSTAPELIVKVPAAYRLRVQAYNGGPVFITGDIIVTDAIAAQNLNYVTTINILTTGVVDDTNIFDLNDNDLQVSTSYFDGLGRPIQSVDLGSSPKKEDVIQPITYDAYGRQSINYLPYATSDANGTYRTTDIDPVTYTNSDQYQFYQTEENVSDDPAPYSEKVFEASPLNRVLEQGSPGAAWQPIPDDPLNGKTVKFGYEINTLEDSVFQWFIVDQNEWPNKAAEGNFYPAGQLYKSIITDEEGNRVIEFINKLQQTILKRVQAIDNPDLNNYIVGQWADTYYIYDDFGNLRFVLPPEAIAHIEEYGNE